MGYKYTDEGVFKGKLLKQPPLPATDTQVAAVMKSPALTHLRRRWLHYGCAVEELGRFQCYQPNNDVKISALVWHLHDQLTNPQIIDNNDGYGPAATDKNGRPLFAPRYVICALTDDQINSGIPKVLIEYFGFEKIAPFFGNTEKTYGMRSRIGLYGLCTTRYIEGDEEAVAT